MNEWVILGLVLSICFNVLWVLVLVGTGWGKSIVKRWWKQRTFKYGNHVNSLMIRNNNTAKEVYTKILDDESFEFNKGKYAVNPKVQFILDGIPTQLNLEGIAEPIDPKSRDLSEYLSTAELKKIIINNKTKSGLDVISKWAPIIAIALLIVTLGVLWLSYSQWQIFDVVVQQSGVGVINPR